MPKKPHPADLRDAQIIAAAVRFEIGLFQGRGRYAKATAATLSEALAAADRLVRDNPSGRRPLIYALDREGRSALVQSTASTKEKAMQTYSKRFGAQRAAKAAGYALENVDIIKTEDGFGWRPKKDAPKPDPELAKPKKRKTAQRMSKSRRAEAAEEAAKGVLPGPPDFSAHTHARFRGKLAKLISLAEAGDIDALKAVEINPVSTSPKAMARYRDLCVAALEAKPSSNP